MIPVVEDALLQMKIEQYRDVLRTGEVMDLRVRGFSMWPFLRDGETVRIGAADFDSLRAGDMILTVNAGRAVCHRVFRKRDGRVWTKADALVGLDGPSGPDEVLGKVLGKIVAGRFHKNEGVLPRWGGVIILGLTWLTAPVYPPLRLIRRKVLKAFSTPGGDSR